MKKNILFAFILLLLTYSLNAQTSDYKVVFDISSKDSISQQAVVREVDIIKTANPNAKLEVVVYGQGLSLVLKDQSAHAEAMQKLMLLADVSFKVCAITMSRNHADKNQLIAGVQMVPDGIYEIISKQKEGWGYIKVAH